MKIRVTERLAFRVGHVLARQPGGESNPLTLRETHDATHPTGH